jgi:putative N6-adenine-specific DNA methylase
MQGRTAQVSADAGGSPLYQRGYRTEAGPAPLRETLAAALLHAGGYDGRMPLWDPMCGSGTIPIEAALWQKPIPWKLRRFAIDDWRVDARVPQVHAPIMGPTPLIVAGDLDADVLGLAHRNAERAGVAEQILWQHAEVALQEPPQAELGLVATNPPYGKRLGGRNAARRLYERLGAVLARRCPGWQVAILAPERDLGDKLPLEGAKVRSMDSGGLQVWLITGIVATGRTTARRRA